MLSRRLLIAATAVPILALSLVACAPEPGEAGDPGAVAGVPEKGVEGNVDSDWGEKSDPNDPSLKTVELPENFPSEAFALPEGAVIDDAGDRGGVWFVNLRAADEAQADAWWDAIVSTNGLSVSDEQETSDGGLTATLTGATVTVSALRLPLAGGGVMLSYDIMSQVV